MDFDTLSIGTTENLGYILLIIYALFVVSSLVVRITPGDYMDRLPDYDPTIMAAKHKAQRLAFVVGGFMDKPENAMKYIDLPDYQIVAITNDNFGFRISQYRDILDKYASNKDVAIGISIGAKAVVESNAKNQILINPCTDPYALYKESFWPAKIFAPILQFLSFILGWLSFIPFIRGNDGYYSLAFFADQLWAIGYGWPEPSTESNIGIIISTDDEFLDNRVIIEDFEQEALENSTIVEINTEHATIGTRKDAEQYQEAINYLLK